VTSLQLNYEGQASHYNRRKLSAHLELGIIAKIKDHWVSGLCPSIGILNTRKHNVSETGPLSVLK
jgi:hypothetical protein